MENESFLSYLKKNILFFFLIIFLLYLFKVICVRIIQW